MAIEPRIIGVNARNLKTLDIDLSAFSELLPMIPDSIIRVAESGISARSEVEVAQAAGAHAILVGETLVRAGNPRTAIDQLLGRRP
jgi:indole-3-glycerol phosphate synthase